MGTMLANKTNNKAFTIIEVVLVLAVAGLIFLIVFQALPRLQASRRDTARKSDAQAIVAQTQQFKINSGGLPRVVDVNAAFSGSTSSPFYSYIDDEDFKDPSTGSLYKTTNGLPSKVGVFRWYVGPFKCNDSNSSWAYSGAGKQDWFFIMKLERGFTCIDGY